MLDVKVTPVNEFNPQKVIELLNSNKNNLPSLVIEYNNIIELYLQIIGIKNLGRANANEIILPEIEHLLKTQNYNCKFTKEGIYNEHEHIFSVLDDKEISIKNGKNSIKLLSCIMNGSKRGILIVKEFHDFSTLSERDKKVLSTYALNQIPDYLGNISTQKDIMILNSICIFISAIEGIEVSKKVVEEYVVPGCPENFQDIITTISYDLDSPSISYSVKSEKSPSLKEHIEQHIEDFMKPNSTEQNDERKTLYNYGDSILCKTNEIEEESFYEINKDYKNEIETELYNLLMHEYNINYQRNLKDLKNKYRYSNCLKNGDEKEGIIYDNFDYRRLFRNLQQYRKRYPDAMHPIEMYMLKWKKYFNEKYKYISEVDKQLQQERKVK